MKFNLHPQAQAAADEINELLPEDDSVEAARPFLLKLVDFAGPIEQMAKVEDRTVDTSNGPVPIRIYRPILDEILPAVIYFHGGWFFMGDLDTHDRTVRSLANASGCLVVAVDYRLAPEHPCPAAADDAYAVTDWVATNAGKLGIDPNRISVVGDSAGGNLAAVVALRARDRSGPKLAFQALIYPVTDASLDTPSWREFAEGPVLTHKGGVLAWDRYVPNQTDRQHPDVSPLHAPDLSGLPPALVITAEFDGLRDEGEAYAEGLKRAGVPVTLTRYPGMVHGFFTMAGKIDDGRKAINEVAQALRTGVQIFMSA